MMKAKKVLILFFALLLCIGGCDFHNTNNLKLGNDNYTNYDFGITREQFNCTFDLTYDDEVVKIADGILGNQLTVNYTLESMEYDFDTLDWNVQYTESPNTFQLYLQCLNPVMYLTKAYEITGDIAYLDMGEKFIKSWADYLSDSKESEGNAFLWYDHGTALRAENLIYYALVADENDRLSDEMRSLIVNLLIMHGDFLSDENNYTENHNHGIFQDQALIYISYFLDNDKKQEWLQIAKERLEEQKEYAFSSEMVHVENSPGYQIGVMELFRVVAEFLVQFNDEFGNDLYDDVKQSAEFMAYIMKPNGYAAEIGDTNGSVNTTASKNVGLSIFDNDHLTYAATQGEVGIMPELSSKVYPKSGYYISHNDWSKENYTDSTWTMFKSGYSSKTHKHADDNSFMLYSKGYDIFVDPGWYNYVTGNKYRDYFVSSLAHNTIVVDEKTYSVTAENSYKTGIFEYDQNEHYDYVGGFNDMYEGVMFDRHYYNLGDAIIIYDNIISDEEHTYSQLFQLSDSCEVVESSDNEVLIRIADSGYFARVRQIVGNPSLSMITGDFENERYGYISHCMNNLESTTTLKYDVVGKNVDYITLITIEDAEQKVLDIQDIQFDNITGSFHVSKNDGTQFEIQLNARKRMKMDSFTVEKVNDNTFEFFNNYIATGVSYAWYVIDKSSAQVVYKSEYSEKNNFVYSFEQEGDFFIKAYAKDQYDQRKQEVICSITYDSKSNQWVNNTKDYPYLNLRYNGQSYEQISDNKYRFTVDYDYSWNSQILWYIYKNGAGFDSFTTQNENSMEYEFIEPGKYTVMYYLKTPNGNNEFWNFEEIEVK